MTPAGATPATTTSAAATAGPATTRPTANEPAAATAPGGSGTRALAEARRTKRSVEVTAQRTPTRKVVANPNGTLTATLQAAPVQAAGPSLAAGVPGSPVAPAQTGWAMVFSGYPSGSYWGGDGDGVAKVGRCYEDGWCNGIGVARAFFQYDTGWLNGKHILGASFRALNVYSPSCAALPVRAWGTGPVGTGTTWSNQPAGVFDLGGRNVAGGRSDCPSQQYAEYNAHAVVNWSTSPGTGLRTTTVRLSAGNESDQLNWRKFAWNPSLSVTYNTVPGVPTDLTVENGKPCGVGAGEVRINPQLSAPQQSRGPRLWSTIADQDGGTLQAKYTLYERNHTTQLYAVTTTGLNSPGRFSIDVPGQFNVNGRMLSWRVAGFDGVDHSAPSPWCDVTIDTEAPKYAPGVTSPTYKRCPDQVNCPASGAVGFTGGFEFTAGGDTSGRDADVAGFRYTLEGADASGGGDGEPLQERYVAIGADGVARTLVTPPDDGRQTLTVRAVDKAGNVSAVVTTYSFFVGRGTPPVAHWRLDGHGTDTAVVDESPARLDGVLPSGGAVAWRGGRHGDALWFNGTRTAAVTTSKRSAVDTGKSFSVAAWVKLDQADSTFRTAVSQSGSTISGFFLQYNGNTKRWNFTLPATNSDTAFRDVVQSPAAAVAGRWTHLTGVFDDAAKQIRLYVDGVPATVNGHTTPWQATGLAQLGAAQVQKAMTNYWLGSIDDARIYQRVLTEPEIDDLAGRPATEELFWPFEEGSGPAVDVSGNYRLGTLGAGVTRSTGDVGAGGIRFDGSGGTVSTTDPVVRTDSGFTVSARVRLDVTDGTTRTVLSQNGPQASGFELRYRGDNHKWSFSVPTGATTTAVVDSDQLAQAGTWTQLTGVYDHAAGHLRLYVDGQQEGGFVPAQSAATAGGAFRVGAGQQAGGPATPFLGQIDDVHVWTGARTGDQVLSEYGAPVSSRPSRYGAQLARFTNTNGLRIVTNGPVPPGSHYEASLGVPAPAGTPGTRTIYSCRNNTRDYFLDLDCADHANLGAVGQFWISKPDGVDSVPVYRCYIYNVAHFASTDAGCEEKGEMEFLLGYTKAYAGLVRHVASGYPYDHVSSTRALPGGPKPEGTLGYLSMTEQPGTTAWMQCTTGADVFSSVDPACEGKTVIGSSGYVWTEPPAALTSRQVFRCLAGWNELFDSTDPNCEGQTVDRPLGYVVVKP
ncbi:LamG domain-containing protein [Kribbella flavida]|uniref:LamG domain-containing protein n=1 Tax=Kribbella flavida TaxID=182640 RepID=UPI00019BF844|nr:LamG domain-containing protein [Kribbella flavida]